MYHFRGDDAKLIRWLSELWEENVWEPIVKSLHLHSYFAETTYWVNWIIFFLGDGVSTCLNIPTSVSSSSFKMRGNNASMVGFLETIGAHILGWDSSLHQPIQSYQIARIKTRFSHVSWLDVWIITVNMCNNMCCIYIYIYIISNFVSSHASNYINTFAALWSLTHPAPTHLKQLRSEGIPLQLK